MRKSVLLALFLTLAGLGLYLTRSGRSASAQTITLDRSLVALLPPDATTLLGVDVERLKRTSVYRHIEDETNKDRDSHFDDFIAETGFDPRRDVRELLVASSATTGAAAENQFVAVARGQFNIGAISRKLQNEKATVEKYRGFDVFSPDHSRNGRPKSTEKRPHDPGAFTFLDERTVLAGTRPALLAAIDRKLSGGPNLLSNSSLISRAQTISATNQVWAVSQNPGDMVARALPKDDSQSSNFARIFAGMQNSTFALDLMNGLDLKAEGICKTAEDAKTLGDAARGFIAIGRLTASQNEPELMTVFDGIRIEEHNAQLDISVRVDPGTLDKLLEKKPGSKRVRNVSFELR